MLETVVWKYHIVLISEIKNRVDVGIRQPRILEVIVNESMNEINMMNNIVLLAENRNGERLVDMAVVIICSDFVLPNK